MSTWQNGKDKNARGSADPVYLFPQPIRLTLKALPLFSALVLHLSQEGLQLLVPLNQVLVLPLQLAQLVLQLGVVTLGLFDGPAAIRALPVRYRRWSYALRANGDGRLPCGVECRTEDERDRGGTVRLTFREISHWLQVLLVIRRKQSPGPATLPGPQGSHGHRIIELKDPALLACSTAGATQLGLIQGRLFSLPCLLLQTEPGFKRYEK